MRSWVACAVLLLALVASGFGTAGAQRGAAQPDEPQELTSDLFGLTASWSGDWETAEYDDDKDGFIELYLIQDPGVIEFILWAMPGYGGNESACIALSERRLLEDSRNSNVEPGSPQSEGPLTGGESALFTYEFRSASRGTTPWTTAAWCLEMQVGYSVLHIELSAPANDFETALDALDDIEIETTDDLPAPEFPLDASRDDLTSFWSQQFDAWELDPYVPPSYVSFTKLQTSLCGSMNPLDTGWVYCTADNVVFMDVADADDLASRFGNNINLFVLAHETAHHVETLLGMEPCFLSECLSKTENVQFELMADCLAGVWMAYANNRGVLTDTDIEDILVGVADSFSDPEGHGSSALRLLWLLRGLHYGPDICIQPGPDR